MAAFPAVKNFSNPLMKLPALASVLACAALVCACEKQDYAETRAFTHHGEHGASHGGHGEAAHGAAPAAAEKPAQH